MDLLAFTFKDIGGHSRTIFTENIMYFKSDLKYVIAYTTDGMEHLMEDTLMGLQCCLPYTFTRIHNSYLVNNDQVASVKSKQVNWQVVLLNSTDLLPISRRKQQVVGHLRIVKK